VRQGTAGLKVLLLSPPMWKKREMERGTRLEPMPGSVGVAVGGSPIPKPINAGSGAWGTHNTGAGPIDPLSGGEVFALGPRYELPTVMAVKRPLSSYWAQLEEDVRNHGNGHAVKRVQINLL
jgi:hypothetical protein